jgi:hypothetical protein
MENFYFADQNGNPWPRGTVLEVPTLFDHQGIVDYDPWTGQQIMLHNSKKRRCAAVTRPPDFSEGRDYLAVFVPQDCEQGSLIVQEARREVELGVAWTVFDNCQDFVSRVLRGKNGSKTRDFIVGVGLALAILGSL